MKDRDSFDYSRRRALSDRTSTHIHVLPNLEGAARDALNLCGTEVRNDSAPLPDGGRTDAQRPRDIRGVLKVINNVLFQHGTSFTTVKSRSQPKLPPQGLTSVAMDKLATIAERLEDAMKEAKVNGAQLASACDVSSTAVHKWLNGGKLSADNSACAARALGVREEWLRTGRLPRERDAADIDERQTEKVMELLENLRAPLAALSQAIEALSKARPATGKRKGA